MHALQARLASGIPGPCRVRDPANFNAAWGFVGRPHSTVTAWLLFFQNPARSPHHCTCYGSLAGGGGRKDLRGWGFTCVVPRDVSGSACMCVYVMYIVGIPRYGARPRPRCDGPRRCGKGQKWAPSRCHCAGAHVPCKSRVSSCRQIASISIVPQSTGL